MRIFAWILLVFTVLALVAEFAGLHLPSVSWAFNSSYDIASLHFRNEDGDVVAWFGYLVSALSLVISGVILKWVPAGRRMTPTNKRRLERFFSIPRGSISLGIIGVLVLLAGLDQALVGKKALYLNYGDEVYFPAFERKIVTGEDLGLKGDAAKAEVNYRELAELIDEEGGGSILMPLIPYDPTLDTVAPLFKALEEKQAVLLDEHGDPMQGQVSTLYDEDTSKRHMIYEYRAGVKNGRAVGRMPSGEPVYEAQYREGKLVDGSESYTGEGSMEEFLAAGDGVLGRVFFHAAPPNWQAGHYFGTTPQGNDLVAYLYGGLQLNIRAVLIFIPIIYCIGISVGLVMGYFGGVFDIVVQRFIEIFSTIPFLFVVIIFGSVIPAENRGLGMILLILILFGWMGMTYLMRTAALKEKARDYIAAARVSGASTSRIIFTHILPNTVAILVTLVPFSVSSVILSLSSLDYLGFGLPPQFATWGNLLNAGLSNLSKPWLASSAFLALVSTLILVTFVGEAVREAFDPKKFTTYK
ncbi:ABC transporter permease subunit [Rubritalea spongiae]|uniref:ABC transporter permease subunit n=1 Tax=Rubritalea spongiae TaxID=430797 RepID=A0ABW5E5J2_9BACT